MIDLQKQFYLITSTDVSPIAGTSSMLACGKPPDLCVV